MKLSKQVFMATLLMVAFFMQQSIYAGFSNGGTMQSKSLNLTIGGTLENNGSLIGIESANITCDTLTGKGLIQSPQITLKTKLFAYTGKIHCTGKCVIVSSAPFNKKMFKQTGGGEFVFIVDEDLGKKSINEINTLDHEYHTDEFHFITE